VTPLELSRSLARIGELIEELEQVADIATRERARALVQTLLDLHRAGLARLLTLLAERGQIDELAGDETVALLLSLHGLHPRSLDARVSSAIDELSPRLLEQGVAVDLTGVTEETVRVRLRAAGTVRAGVAGLRAAVESAIRRTAPEIVAVEIEGLETSDVPVTRLGSGPPRS
jgi:hypothetical protein